MGIKMYETDEPPQTITVKNEISDTKRTGDFLEHLGILRLGRNIFFVRSREFRRGFAICNYAGDYILYQ